MIFNCLSNNYFYQLQGPSALSQCGGDSTAATDSPERELPNWESPNWESQSPPCLELPNRELTNRELPNQELSIKESSHSSPPMDNFVRVIHSQPVDTHTDVQFAQIPGSPQDHLDISNNNSNLMVTNDTSSTDDQLQASLERNLKNFCSAGATPEPSVQCSIPRQEAQSHRRKDRRTVTYVISVTSVTKKTNGKQLD